MAQMTGRMSKAVSYTEAVAKAPINANNHSVQARIPPDIAGLKGSTQLDLVYRRVFYTKINPSTRKKVAAAEDKSGRKGTNQLTWLRQRKRITPCKREMKKMTMLL